MRGAWGLPPDLMEGARNLLVDCAGLAQGDALLIVREDPALGWYDADLAPALARAAAALGLRPEMVTVGGPTEEIASLPDHDAVVFLARIGDQNRFAAGRPGQRRAMVYLRDADSLAGAYGRIPHGAMTDLRDAVNAALTGAARIEITCPLGTRLTGATVQAPDTGDVTVQRFPLGVPVPVLGAGFSGRVALARWLTPTGSRAYNPGAVALEEPIFARVAAGRIEGFEGAAAVVGTVERHYERIGARFGIDPWVMHSWHPGFHPAGGDTRPAAQDPDRWANTVFTSPRIVHFHTCGAYAPGEICWMVLDPTVTLDGTALWRRGLFQPQAMAGARAVTAAWPALSDAFERPAVAIGL